MGDGARYCSIDPEQLPRAPFATKARLAVSPGRYTLDGDGRIVPPSLVLDTPRGRTRLAPEGSAALRLLPALGETGDGEASARLELRARYATAGGASLELVLIADALGERADADGARFGLGDPRDAETFLARGRRLLLRTGDASPLFPEADGAPVGFAPCELPARSDERFVFALDGGTAVAVTVRAAVGVHQLGFYIGRALEARVRDTDGTARVAGHESLAFIGGSGQLGELALPTLAVRTAPRAGRCGYLFDASLWDSPEARDGYVARTLGCDGRARRARRARLGTSPRSLRAALSTFRRDRSERFRQSNRPFRSLSRWMTRPTLSASSQRFPDAPPCRPIPLLCRTSASRCATCSVSTGTTPRSPGPRTPPRTPSTRSSRRARSSPTRCSPR